MSKAETTPTHEAPKPQQWCDNCGSRNIVTVRDFAAAEQFLDAYNAEAVASPPSTESSEAARQTAREIATALERCEIPHHVEEAEGYIVAIISKHFPASTEVGEDARRQPEHDWRWWDRYLRSTGYTDLANRTLAEFKPEGLPANQQIVGEHCVKCGHNNVSDAEKSTSIYGMCIEPVRKTAEYKAPEVACGCHCVFESPGERGTQV